MLEKEMPEDNLQRGMNPVLMKSGSLDELPPSALSPASSVGTLSHKTPAHGRRACQILTWSQPLCRADPGHRAVSETATIRRAFSREGISCATPTTHKTPFEYIREEDSVMLTLFAYGRNLSSPQQPAVNR